MRDIEEMATITSDQEGDSQAVRHELLLSITLDQEIIQFSRECERVTAYTREEVLHKKFSDILLPVEYFPQLRILLDTIQKTGEISEFTLPLKTKQGVLVPVTWNGFLMKEEQGSQYNICLLGISTQTHNTLEGTDAQDSPSIKAIFNDRSEETNEKQQITPSVTSVSCQQIEQEMSIEKNISNGTSHDDSTLQQAASSLQSIERLVGTTSKQLDDLSLIIQNLSEKYETINERLGDLERKDEQSEKIEKQPVRHLEPMESGYPKLTKKKMKTSPSLHFPKKESSTFEKKPGFFSDPLGYTRQRKDLNKKLQECEHRQKELEAFEAQLLQEKKIFDSRIEEFRQWRDKLEQLEMEIEKRRQELLELDVALGDQIPQISLNDSSDESKINNVVASETPNYQQILDGITQSAVIVQRGILKQINTPFAELIGYPVTEIVEKNFFDFIAVDGLEGVEQYYLSRLKGESTSSYTTVFSTKQNEKVVVEVSVKPMIYNGEKAEIAIMTILESQKQEG